MQHKADSVRVTQDWVVFGALTGAVLSVFRTAFVTALGRAGIPSFTYTSVASALVLGKKATHNVLPSMQSSRTERVIGVIADGIVGSAYGAFGTFAYSRTPPGREALKGAMIGAGIWFTNMSAGRYLRIDGLAQLPPMALLTNLLVTTTSTAIHGAMYARWGTQRRADEARSLSELPQGPRYDDDLRKAETFLRPEEGD